MKMRRIKFFFLTAFTILLSLSAQSKQNNTWIVQLKNNKAYDNTLSADKITTPLFVKLLRNYTKNADIPLSTRKSKLINSLLSYRTIRLNNNELSKLDRSNILLLEPNYVYRIEQDNTKPNDPRYNEQWALKYLSLEKAWQKATGNGIIVGVVDTGIEWEHKDLKKQLWINSAEDINGNGKFDAWSSSKQIDGVSGDLNGIDDDRNGSIDDVIGYDFVNQQITNLGDHKDYDPIPVDEYGHGTLVSGVIAAEHNNHIGIAGIAYNAKILTMRAFDITGQGTSDNIASAIIYGVLNGVKVFNLSFGEKENSSLMQDAINFAIESGCVVVASSGNEGSDAPHYPSDYEGVISVGYSKKDGRRNGFSNYGSRLDLLAPGTFILTTSFTGKYRLASGSSLSAPFVSSTAALLLETKPTLSPIDVQGIIDNSADDGGRDGWDIFFGAGILNINRALDFTGRTNLTITQPQNEQTVFKSETSVISFTGSIIVPLINEYILYLGEGYNPEKWTKIAGSTNQIKNDTIFSLNTNNLKDTAYTFRILVKLRNNNTIEKRVCFNIANNKNDIRFLSINKLPAYANGKRIMLLGIETNIPTVTYITLTDNNGEKHSFSDLQKRTKFHIIPIDDHIQPDTDYNCKISATPDILTKPQTNKDISIRINDDKFSIDKFIKKKYSTTLSYIYNKTGDFNSDGKQEYIANDITHGIWSGTDVYQFNNNELIKRDSTKEISLPVGIGDSNGDGIDEVLTRNVGSTKLYQSKLSQYSLFSNILFSDTTSGNLFAGTMYDFTGDGKEELVCYSDTAVYIISYVNKHYQIIASAMLDGKYRRIGTAPGIACGDFDGDSNDELAFGNDRGNIFIFEFKNNSLHLEYSNTINYSYSPQYITTADIDNDGKPEIAIANFGTAPLFGRNVNAEPIWSLKILKSIEANNYGYMFGEYFYGVKQGSTPAGVFFRNGLSAGDIGLGTDAILMSPFPSMYIFTWNKTKNKMNPFWYYPSAFANSAIIHDFDGNGVNEFGFSTGRATEFFEYSKNIYKPNMPVEFEGWSISNDKVYLQWKSTATNNSPNATKFSLFYGRSNGEFIKILGTTETDKHIHSFSGLIEGNDYWFGIASISNTGSTSDTLIKLIHHHKPIKLKSIKQINRKRFSFSFTGKVPQHPLLPSTLSANSQLPDVITRANDSTLLAFWNSPLPTGNVTFTANSFRDYYNAPSMPDTIIINISDDIPPPDELYLKNIKVISFYELDLQYSEPVNQNEALIISNYLLSPNGRIESINRTQNPSIVHIQLDRNSTIGPLGKDYSLTVKNVHSKSGKPMTKGAGNTISFTFQSNELSNAFVYPNPIRISTTASVYFANLTYYAEVYIYDLEGREIAVLKETDGNGGVEWNLHNKNNNRITTGVYLFNVKGKSKDGENIESGLKKFAIVR